MRRGGRERRERHDKEDLDVNLRTAVNMTGPTWYVMNLVTLSLSLLLGLFRIISSMSPFIFSITT